MVLWLLLLGLGAACCLIRWIFSPAILSAQKDRRGTKPDTFFFQQQEILKFSQQIFSPSTYDLTLVIPAFNEVKSFPDYFIVGAGISASRYVK